MAWAARGGALGRNSGGFKGRPPVWSNTHIWAIFRIPFPIARQLADTIYSRLPRMVSKEFSTVTFSNNITSQISPQLAGPTALFVPLMRNITLRAAPHDEVLGLENLWILLTDGENHDANGWFKFSRWISRKTGG